MINEEQTLTGTLSTESNLTSTNVTATEDYSSIDGTKGPKGDTGEGVPTGGTTGQTLVKKSNTDYDTEWADAGTGNVINSTTSINENVAIFNGTDGKHIKDSGINLSSKQNVLVNGETIKSINSTSLLGSGNMILQTPLTAGTDYLVPNSNITGATKTKITYDSKGLITGGADATTADIADSTNKRYVTDSEKTLLSNTSGINTGDETTSTIKTKLSAATSSNDGYATSAQISKLDGIATNANNYILPEATSSILGGVKVDNTTITASSGTISAVNQKPTGGNAGQVLFKNSNTDFDYSWSDIFSLRGKLLTESSTAGKFYCSITETLNTNDAFDVVFPSAITNSSSSVQLSIDGGTTYYPLKYVQSDSDYTDFSTNELIGKKGGILFDGTYFLLDKSKYNGKLVSNLNTITRDNNYTCYTGTTGLSTEMNALGVSFHIHHQNSNVGTNGAFQIATSFETVPKRYYRIKISGTYSDWVRFPELAGTQTWTGVNTFKNALINQNPTSAYDSAPLGSELVTSITAGGGWGGSIAAGYTHTAGTTNTLTSSITPTVNSFYQQVITITGRTAGSVTLAFGGWTTTGITATASYGFPANSTSSLVITPTSDFNGTVSISIKLITGYVLSVNTTYDSTGAITNEFRPGLASLENTYSGLAVGQQNTTGIINTGFGINALSLNTTGSYNTANGSAALRYNTTGVGNSAFGTSSLRTNSVGGYNTAVGVNSLYSNVSTNYLTAVGYKALYANTSGYENTAVGYNSLYSTSSGYQNMAIGYIALQSNTSGYKNTAVGSRALNSNTTSYCNSALGYAALNTNNGGNYNTALGNQSLYANTTGSSNTGAGDSSLYSNTTGINNTAIGAGASYSNLTGSNNTTVGYGSLITANGDSNVAIGSNAGRYIADGVTTNTTSTQHTIVGTNAYPKADGDTNEIVIGYSAIGNGSNTTTIGNSLITDTYLGGSTHSAQFVRGVQTLTDASTINWNTNLGAIANVTLGDNRTMATPTNIKAGAKYILQIIQDSTGSRTLNFSANYLFPGNVIPTLTTTANAVDIMEFTCFDGTNLIMTKFQQMSTDYAPRHIITAYTTSDYTIPAAGSYYLPPYVAYNVLGTKLTISANKVVIGAGVSKVLITSCEEMLTSATTGTKYFGLAKNGSILFNTSMTVPSGERSSISFPPILLNVAQNDTIDFRVYGAANDVVGGSMRTGFTVEAVA